MQHWRLSSYICLSSILVLTGLRQFYVSPLEDTMANTLWFFIQVTPLILPLSGLLKNSIRSTLLISLASLLYFMHGVVKVYEGSGVVIGGFEIVFALGLCVSTSFVVRGLREADSLTSIPPQKGHIPL